jgi:hypothetical protein
MPANPGLYVCPCGMDNGVWLVAGGGKCMMCGWTLDMYEAAQLADERRKQRREEEREKRER